MNSPAPKRMTALDGGVEAGIRWAICQAPLRGAVNGYAQMPDGHQWLTKSLQGEDYDLLTAPGGITYGPDSAGWVGFDTLHSGDLWPGGGGPDYCPPGECDCTIWTAEMVADNARLLARQIAAADPTLATAVSR
jgi:hypothetical protein